MHRRFAMWLLVAAMGFLLGACSDISVSSTDLMRPPRLTAEQKALDDALKASVLSDPILKYPKNGDHRSAFVFHDLDGDGQEEAIAFYATEPGGVARITVLGRTPQGEWRALRELPGADREVEFITFAHVTSRERADVVIGWGNPDDSDMTLGVYSYEDGRLIKRLRENSDAFYNSYVVEDLDGDGLDDIFLLTRNAGNRAKASWIRQISFDGYAVDTVRELPLSDSILDFASVLTGRLSAEDNKKGIFIDELLAGGELVTEVYTVENGVLAAVIHHDMPEPEPPSEGELDNWDDRSLYEQTRRSDTAAVCADVNGDGIVELSTAGLLPGYDDEDIYEDERIYLTTYKQLQDQALAYVFAAVVNRPAGYMVRFPAAWVDEVTVVNQIESNEWRFFKYNGSLEDLSEELLRIRVVSRKDYQDKFLSSYIVLQTRGQFTYYGDVTEAPGHPLAISPRELTQELFSLI